MRAPHLFPLAALGCALAVSALAENAAPPAEQGWMQWRGPLANGVAPHANPPTEWSEQKNVRWKIPLPGKAHSSPIVFGERVYLTAAVPVGEDLPPVYDTAPGAHDGMPVTHRHQFTVLAVERRDGRIAWQKVVREEFPHEGGHVTGSLASSSPKPLIGTSLKIRPRRWSASLTKSTRGFR